MATPLAFTATYSHSADAVRAAIASEQYWKDRLAEVGGPGARLESFEPAGEVLTIRMVQTIAASELPSSITSVRPGDMIIPRTEVYTAGSNTGTFEAHVDGAPAEVNGTVTLTENGSGTVATVEGSVHVAVPLFGKKIEAVVAEKLLELLASEAAFTDTWVSQH
ncbi:DUF2505 domain-containing protein [Nocardia sp. BMG111209]|uniref:DUF2505 domain-containing protein n=1 Tax=Nocardia sp. BMG111209 TaxID=1160137 RepID=UPI0003814A0A|nr:DUF2505 domain-containing protein [Nocardia sp. BMG111209]